MFQEYTLLIALKNNIPGTVSEEDVEKIYVDDYHTILDSIEVRGIDLSVYRIPENRIGPRVLSTNPRTGKRYSEKKYCKRGFLLSKLEALIMLFELQKEGVKNAEIKGFEVNQDE